MSEREKVITWRWIWGAGFILSLTLFLLAICTDVLEYCSPTEKTAWDAYMIECVFWVIFVLPLLCLVGIIGFLCTFLMRSEEYCYHGYTIFIYAGSFRSFAKISENSATESERLVPFKKQLFSPPNAKTVALGNGEEIIVHISRANRIAVQTQDGYLAKEEGNI